MIHFLRAHRGLYSLDGSLPLVELWVILVLEFAYFPKYLLVNAFYTNCCCGKSDSGFEC